MLHKQLNQIKTYFKVGNPDERSDGLNDSICTDFKDKSEHEEHEEPDFTITTKCCWVRFHPTKWLYKENGMYRINHFKSRSSKFWSAPSSVTKWSVSTQTDFDTKCSCSLKSTSEIRAQVPQPDLTSVLKTLNERILYRCALDKCWHISFAI